MFTRSILIPSLVVCAIATPILFSQAKRHSPSAGPSQAASQQTPGTSMGSTWLPTAQSKQSPQVNPFQQTSSANFQTAPSGNPIFYQAGANGNPALNPASQPGSTIGTQPAVQPSNLPNLPLGHNTHPTLILPANANGGPDWTATPMQFMPVANFEEIFRFDITPDWVKSRWNRISTNHGDRNLHGLRVALITGTNSWDLHGSLTYYFDQHQQAQRITFRGWAGDASMLTNYLQRQYQFKKQPTHWAGFYLAKKGRDTTGGILMKYPTVIYSQNPIQQIAAVLEINNPKSNSVLSDEFHSLIAGSQSSR